MENSEPPRQRRNEPLLDVNNRAQANIPNINTHLRKNNLGEYQSHELQLCIVSDIGYIKDKEQKDQAQKIINDFKGRGRMFKDLYFVQSLTHDNQSPNYCINLENMKFGLITYEIFNRGVGVRYELPYTERVGAESRDTTDPNEDLIMESKSVGMCGNLMHASFATNQVSSYTNRAYNLLFMMYYNITTEMGITRLPIALYTLSKYRNNIFIETVCNVGFHLFKTNGLPTLSDIVLSTTDYFYDSNSKPTVYINALVHHVASKTYERWGFTLFHDLDDDLAEHLTNENPFLQRAIRQNQTRGTRSHQQTSMYVNTRVGSRPTTGRYNIMDPLPEEADINKAEKEALYKLENFPIETLTNSDKADIRSAYKKLNDYNESAPNKDVNKTLQYIIKKMRRILTVKKVSNKLKGKSIGGKNKKSKKSKKTKRNVNIFS